MCTVLLPPGGYPIAVNKYTLSYHIIYHIISYISYIISSVSIGNIQLVLGLYHESVDLSVHAVWMFWVTSSKRVLSCLIHLPSTLYNLGNSQCR